ncbi:MAG: right-handed parallel beta-helix repeat-containing protein [Candidatus Cloacimonetes bacterium]|nr:right-handed parallel beta-helix repeat-containing protein [Candidatus Cloacimonadota bacterium]
MKIILIFLLLVFLSQLSAIIINIPADYPTIQIGINVAADGDTVLVQPGTYVENIIYNGHNVNVASLFFITQDTTYISQTIIDGNNEDCVVRFEDGEDSTAVLCGFTIQNGLGQEMNEEIGGGINCENSSPKIINNKIINNVGDPGGGIGLKISDAIIEGNYIHNNHAESSWMTNRGGGISCIASDPIIRNNTISNNSLNWGNGGGIYCSNSNPLIENCIITGNENNSYLAGAGIHCLNSSPVIKDVIISENSGELGGGLYLLNSDPILENVSINNNCGYQGGGIYIEENSHPVFDTLNRCNIYGNNSSNSLGVDLYINSNLITDVIVDTFSVLYPNNYYFYSEGSVNFDILHCYTVQIEDDVFVSSQGNNNNSGLSWNESFKTLTYAISRIRADSLHHYTIFLADDTFSFSTNGEQFPIYGLSYLDIAGTSCETTILDAETENEILRFIDVTNSNISNCKLTNGFVGCTYLVNSEVNFDNMKITNNETYSNGGAIYAENSNSTINNCVIESNMTNHRGNVYFTDGNLEISNTCIFNNLSEKGAGLFCSNVNLELYNVLFYNNAASEMGGGIYLDNCNSLFSNVSIHNNSSNQFGGGIYCVESTISFDEDNRCNLYDNEIDLRSYGKEIYAEQCETMNVFLDTFTVSNPSDYYASPLSIFNFDILNNTQGELINSDLYVSVIGDDTNSGTSAEDPLLTLSCALSKIYADSLNQNTIHLSSGVFSYETTGEIFPVEWCSFVNLEGCDDGSTVLHSNVQDGVLVFHNVSDAIISNVSISNEYPEYAAGIVMQYSSPVLKNISVSGISGYGIACSDFSNPIIYNAFLNNNIYGFGCSYSSEPFVINSLIFDNSSRGITSHYDSNPTIVNTTIVNNVYPIYIRDSNANFHNCILFNDHIYEIDAFQNSSVTISYCDIEGGIDAVHVWVGSILFWLDGNIDEDPLFAGTGVHPFTLLESSPCIDTGTPETTGLNLPPWDLINNERIWDGDENGIAVIDMGAYEYGAPPYIVGIEEPIITNSQALINYLGNYPNPFNPSTTIKFSIQNDLKVELSIFNIKGQKVTTLINEHMQKGKHSICWSGCDQNGNHVSSGIYFYKIKAGTQDSVKRMLLLK